MDTKEVFEDIYIHRKWGGPKLESASGTGSTILTTTQLRKDLMALCNELKVKTFIDAPCGDLNWTSYIPWEAMGVKYIGVDIVRDLVSKNAYKIPTGMFIEADITKDNLPHGDIIMVRDCLFHLSYDLIHKAIANLKRSNIKYLLSTTFIEHPTNIDIVTGGWRTINLETAPFNFHKPVKFLQDFYPDPQFHDKRLSLWEISKIG